MLLLFDHTPCNITAQRTISDDFHKINFNICYVDPIVQEIEDNHF